MKEKLIDKVEDMGFWIGFVAVWFMGIIIALPFLPYYLICGEEKTNEIIDRVALIGKW